MISKLIDSPMCVFQIYMKNIVHIAVRINRKCLKLKNQGSDNVLIKYNYIYFNFFHL